MTIPFSLIDEGQRARTQYSGIEELAQQIDDVGLVQPIILTPRADGRYALVAGGRRYRALLLLGTTELYHATSSTPGRPGYVLKDAGDSLSDAIIEIVENQNREDMHWVDEMTAIVKAWKLARLEANERGEELMARVFGAMIGRSHAAVQSAISVYDDYQKNPERYSQCTGITSAMQTLLKVQATEVAKVQAARMTPAPAASAVSAIERRLPRPAGEPQTEALTIPLSRSFFNLRADDLLAKLPDASVDHIVTDPDYGVSVEALQAGVAGAATGVAQADINQTLEELSRFLREAWRILRDHSFLVMFYDMDHHEKLQALARSAGFRVQRWPLIWHKIDYRSNAAPSYNFCKNIEYAMVLRKPAASLTQAQMTSVFSCPTGNITKVFNHPFAKPLDLWSWIYRAIAIENQIVLDPFMGSATSCVAAIKAKLRPIGAEVDSGHFANGLFNLQQEYRTQYGADTLFS